MVEKVILNTLLDNIVMVVLELYQVSGYAKYFDSINKQNDKKLLEAYKIIRAKVSCLLKKGLDSDPAYND